jgi:hypothetical protein
MMPKVEKRGCAGDISTWVWVQTNPGLQKETSGNKLKYKKKKRGCAGDIATK